MVNNTRGRFSIGVLTPDTRSHCVFVSFPTLAHEGAFLFFLPHRSLILMTQNPLKGPWSLEGGGMGGIRWVAF